MIFRKMLCKLGFHWRVKHVKNGIKCIDCGHFKSKYECQADIHAGGK